MKFAIEVTETTKTIRVRHVKIELDAKDEEHARALVERAYTLLPRESVTVTKEDTIIDIPSVDIQRIGPAT